jgi:integrative and conjugative element protein (TIGR02256 family)
VNRNRHWTSADGRFAATMPSAACDAVEKHIRAAHPNETGGVLAGKYDDELAVAIITEASGPPPDSRADRIWFQRGAENLAKQMYSLWSKPSREYYLGEWHYHPADHIEPSPDDVEQMKQIAASAKYACPEPLMFIFGESQHGLRTVRGFVYPRGRDAIELHETAPQMPPNRTSRRSADRRR